MAKVKILKRPPTAEKASQIMLDKVQKGFDRIGKRHVDEREQVVGDFNNKPEFDHEVKRRTTNLTLNVLLTNPDQPLTTGNATIEDLHRWNFETGNPPHKIRAKEGGLLAFRAGKYQRKRGVSGSKGSGKVSGGAFRRVEEVNHPGYKPSKAIENVNAKLLKPLEEATDKAVEQALNVLSR